MTPLSSFENSLRGFWDLLHAAPRFIAGFEVWCDVPSGLELGRGGAGPRRLLLSSVLYPGNGESSLPSQALEAGVKGQIHARLCVLRAGCFKC